MNSENKENVNQHKFIKNAFNDDIHCPGRDLTIIDKIHHLDRGYEHLVSKLTECGASIERI